jgi:hypothetical protein
MYTSPQRSPQSALKDPSLLSAARELYQTYLSVHESRAKEPVGVILHCHSYRGKLLFRAEPILLPEECFIPFQQIQSGVAT